jgi:hypothetical protein
VRTLATLLALAGCADAADSGEELGHTITLRTTLHAEGGVACFLTPNATLVEVPEADLAGKPYVVSIFEGGFSQGNDEPLDLQWGHIPDDLVITMVSDGYAPGPYDASVIVYVNTPVDEADMTADGSFDPTPPVGGDLSAFTLDDSDVLEGDPTFEAGVVRINVIDGDTTKELANHTPTDPEDGDQVLEAFDDTILLVP